MPTTSASYTVTPASIADNADRIRLVGECSHQADSDRYGRIVCAVTGCDELHVAEIDTVRGRRVDPWMLCRAHYDAIAAAAAQKVAA